MKLKTPIIYLIFRYSMSLSGLFNLVKSIKMVLITQTMTRLINYN